MDKIPSSFMGYNKTAVQEIIKRKNSLLQSQQEDIDYLRNENLKLKKKLKIKNSQEIEPER